MVKSLLIFLTLVCCSTASAGRLSVLFGSGSSGGVSFSGYTSAYDGNLGGIKGANQKCAAAYTGSRVCLYDDFITLGANYPYTYDVWWLDGVTAYDGLPISKLGAGIASANGGGACASWNNAGASLYGFIFSTSGTSGSNTCSATYRLACCK